MIVGVSVGVAYGGGETGRALIPGRDCEGEDVLVLSVQKSRERDDPCLIVNHKHGA